MDTYQTPSTKTLENMKINKSAAQVVFVMCIIVGAYVSSAPLWGLLGFIMLICVVVISSVNEKSIAKIERKIANEATNIKNAKIREQNRQKHNLAYGRWLQKRSVGAMELNKDGTLYNGFTCAVKTDEVLGYTPNDLYSGAILMKSTEYGFTYIIENTKGHRRIPASLYSDMDTVRVPTIKTSSVMRYKTTRKELIISISEHNIKIASDVEFATDDIIGADDVLSNDMIEKSIMTAAIV